jgi:hypothetical protein
MKKLAILFAGLFIMAISVQNVYAQPGASDDGTATALILEPLSITAVENLEFGSIAAGNDLSEIKISTSGARTLESGTAALYTSNAGRQGTFDVGGENDATYAITLPANGTITLTGPGTALVVKDFESDPDGTGTLNASGEQTINVGATIEVPAGQSAGNYSGQYQVTVDYN